MNKNSKNNRAWFLVPPVFLLVAFSVDHSADDRRQLRLPRHFRADGPGCGSGVPTWSIRCWPTEGSPWRADPPARVQPEPFSRLRSRSASPWRWPCRASGARASATLVIMALPLLIPWNWSARSGRSSRCGDIGPLGRLINRLGIDYNYRGHPWDAWLTPIVVMDVWHWTPLVALLCLCGPVELSLRGLLPGGID